MKVNTSNPSTEFYPELLQINRANSETWSSFSYDGTDLISFEDATCATELSSRPPSSTSFLDDSTLSTVPRTKPANCGGVYVSVSGTTFSVPPEAFAKMDNLNWMRDESDGSCWQLNTSPAIFEIILGYMIFETLPAIDTLSKAEYDEFEPMALSVGLYELVEHFDRSSDKRLRSSNNDRRRSLKQKHKGTPIVLNNENVRATSVKLIAANNRCARFLASIKRKGSTRFRTRKSTKTTHDQWCASDHVN